MPAPKGTTPLRTPSRPQQADYDLLRRAVTQAIAQDWHRLRDASPALDRASRALDSFLQGHPDTSFRIFRPEDADFTHEAGSRLYLR